jgi:hypothetical protein
VLLFLALVEDFSGLLLELVVLNDCRVLFVFEDVCFTFIHIFIIIIDCAH